MNSILSKFVGDHRFEVNNNQKFIVVVGMTGVGKSSFVNFITDKNICKVSDSSSTCTAKYEMVSCAYCCGSSYRALYFVDTPGLDDPEGDQKNIKELMKFRNAFPRINTIIYCQKLDDNRFNNSAKILFNLINDLYPDPNLFKNLIIVRTKSDRSSRDFEDNKKASLDFIKKIKEEYKIDDQIEIKQYYIDSKYKDNESIIEKQKILDLVSKMDPIFKEIKILNVEEVILYDSLNNRYEIKEKRNVEYGDHDGSKKVVVEEKVEIQNFGGKYFGAEVVRIDCDESDGCPCCKAYKIIYEIYDINHQNERVLYTKQCIWQTKRDEDQSDRLKEIEEKRLREANLLFV